MNDPAWSGLWSVGLPMFLSILISIISVKNQDNLFAFGKGRAPRDAHIPSQKRTPLSRREAFLEVLCVERVKRES